MPGREKAFELAHPVCKLIAEHGLDAHKERLLQGVALHLEPHEVLTIGEREAVARVLKEMKESGLFERQQSEWGREWDKRIRNAFAELKRKGHKWDAGS